MARQYKRLTAAKIAALKSDGMYADGDQLWLQIDKGIKSWIFRYTSPVTGKQRSMGLGAVREVSLVNARDKAAEMRRKVRDGIDPIDEHRGVKTERALKAKKAGKTFEQVAEEAPEDGNAAISTQTDPR